MLKIFSNYLITFFAVTLLSKTTLAITGEDISKKVSEWLVSKGVNGKPVFSKTFVYKDCKNNLKIKRVYKNYKTIKVNCSDKNGYQLLIRVKTSNKEFKKEKVKVKKNSFFKALRLKRSLEKNSIIELDDLELVELSNSSQISFFSLKKELVGRKLKKNLKMGQLLHPRHLYKKFEVSSGDVISIISNIGNASVTVSGEAQGSGNLGDLIRVKNLRSGKIIKGYIKKNKIIKIYR